MQAMEAGFGEFLESHGEFLLSNGRKRVVYNGYLPGREVQTGVGSMPVKVPRARDRGEEIIRFTSTLLPPYLRRTTSVEQLLPWLHMKGILTNAFAEVLHEIWMAETTEQAFKAWN